MPALQGGSYTVPPYYHDCATKYLGQPITIRVTAGILMSDWQLSTNVPTKNFWMSAWIIADTLSSDSPLRNTRFDVYTKDLELSNALFDSESVSELYEPLCREKPEDCPDPVDLPPRESFFIDVDMNDRGAQP